MNYFFKVCILLLSILSFNVIAGDTLKLSKIKENIYAIVGDLGNRSPDNFGNNATFGFVVTTEGVVLIDSGGSYRGAKKIHQLIISVTEQKIVMVINSGGQDHRWFGNGYFKQLGAEIISSNAALEDHKKRFSVQYSRLLDLIGDTAISHTEAVTATTTFDSTLNFTLGGVDFEITHSGHAHTPGDAYIWLPQHKIVFTGDIVYITRILGVASQSNSRSWIKVFESMAKLNPQILVPGHGGVTTLKKAKSDSYQYLVDVRNTVAEFIENDGDLSDIGSIDWSKYKYLLNYDSLINKNAAKVYTEIEWE